MRVVQIRLEQAADHGAVHEVVRSAFDTELQANLVATLRAAAKPCLSMVAVLDEAIVGHILFSPITFEEPQAPIGAQLSPVSVVPTEQSRGIGGKLIRTGLDACLRLGWSCVFLVGNPKYYARFGFQMAKPRGFTCDGPLDPFLQFIELRPNALQGVGGKVLFHPAFAEAD